MAHETISVIKSCIASRKGGVPLTDIDGKLPSNINIKLLHLHK